MRDYTIVKAHQHRTGKKIRRSIGRSKSGLSIKIYARTDALDNPAGFYLIAE